LKRAFFLSPVPRPSARPPRFILIKSPPKKRQRNITRPRFFERATPNQLWQTDIFTFRLGGHYAYLIGYIDDYSRYITGLELFRSQTGQHVIEVYRRAASEYNPPKEMLTDNGRQYTSWRGNSRFEASSEGQDPTTSSPAAASDDARKMSVLEDHLSRILSRAQLRASRTRQSASGNG